MNDYIIFEIYLPYFLFEFKHTEYFYFSPSLFAINTTLYIPGVFSSRSASCKIRLLSIPKFFLYCCHSDIKFTQKCVLTNFNSHAVSNEKFTAIAQG